MSLFDRVISADSDAPLQEARRLPSVERVKKIERELERAKQYAEQAVKKYGPEALDDYKDEIAELEAKLDLAKKQADKASKSRGYSRGRSDAMKSVGMKRSRYGGWE